MFPVHVRTCGSICVCMSVYLCAMPSAASYVLCVCVCMYTDNYIISLCNPTNIAYLAKWSGSSALAFVVIAMVMAMAIVIVIVIIVVVMI